jgi:hypothetical protein
MLYFINFSNLIGVLPLWHDIFTLYTSDGQLAACGLDSDHSLIYSGPRQVTGFVRLVKVSISA